VFFGVSLICVGCVLCIGGYCLFLVSIFVVLVWGVFGGCLWWLGSVCACVGLWFG